MVGSFVRLAAAAAFCALLAGCSSAPDNSFADVSRPDTSRDDATMTMPDKPLSCVPFARAHSGVNIRGDAYTWWEQAEGRYRKAATPSTGAVMVLAGYSGPKRAHVAVVRRIVSAREIRVDHANWLNNGAIYLDDPVADISPGNDWSQVLVWNVQTHAWGVHVYDVQGFILPGSAPHTDRVASAD
ncbi:MAG: CHAP domain-containing protein [Alphaproteobacteria bacterium]|nr:CHAP domain-containing protein [Alphaproteobacteria bacterium]